jgi:hypothetical protein
MGDWRKLYNEKLNDLYCSPNIICMMKSRRMRWAGHVACIGENRNAYRAWVGKPEKKRPLGRSRHGRENNVKMGVKETGWEAMSWIDMAQYRDKQ